MSFSTQSPTLSQPFIPARAPSQRMRIVDLLRRRGSRGADSRELHNLCLRPGSRICELRQAGYQIKATREDEMFRFVLLSEPETPKPIKLYGKQARRDSKSLSLFARGAA